MFAAKISTGRFSLSSSITVCNNSKYKFPFNRFGKIKGPTSRWQRMSAQTFIEKKLRIYTYYAKQCDPKMQDFQLATATSDKSLFDDRNLRVTHYNDKDACFHFSTISKL
jgi:hypothetical protein